MKEFIKRFLPFIIMFMPMLSAFAGNMGAMAAPVHVVVASRVDLSPSIWVAGSVISSHDARVAAEVEGQIEFLRELGVQIEQGDVIARVNNDKNRLQFNEVKAEIAKTEAQLAFLMREADRLGQLSAGENVAKNKLDEVVSSRDEMSAELDTKHARLSQVQDALDKSIISAPFSGVVVERFKQVGEWLDLGDELVHLAAIDATEIQAHVPPSSFALLKIGQSLVVLDGLQDASATVKRLVPFSEGASRLYEVRFDFNMPQWLVGHAVKVKIPTAITMPVLAVPRDALVIRGDSIKVFRVIEGNIAEEVPITIGVAQGDLVQAIGAVQEGDQIVVRGNETLRNKHKVNIQ